jgi:hypothetical protein
MEVRERGNEVFFKLDLGAESIVDIRLACRIHQRPFLQELVPALARIRQGIGPTMGGPWPWAPCSWSLPPQNPALPAARRCHGVVSDNPGTGLHQRENRRAALGFFFSFAGCPEVYGPGPGKWRGRALRLGRRGKRESQAGQDLNGVNLHVQAGIEGPRLLERHQRRYHGQPR